MTNEEAKPLFREMFPTFRGEAPFGRNPYGKPYGRPDDAQIMDELLFQQLKEGFSDEVTPPIEEGEGPDVIFTTDCYVQEPDGDSPWPKTGAEGRSSGWSSSTITGDHQAGAAWGSNEATG